MIKGIKEYLDQIVQSHVCPEHGPKLVVAWHAEENSYVIRCGAGHFPEEVTRELSNLEELKQGTREPVGKGLNLLPQVDLATGESLTKEIRAALINYAAKYGLDAYRGHVVIMYGKPYITIDGYLYHARESGEPYTLQSRPMTTEEIKQYKIGETDHAWLAKVSLLESGGEFTGVGTVTYEEMIAKSPRDATKLRSPVVAAHPWQLAQKRAEWQALRRGFPIGESEEKEIPPQTPP